MRARHHAVALFSLALAANLHSTWAQETAARLLFFNVKPGATTQFEEAVKQHMAARRATPGAWRWLTWEYQSGELPRYCVASFGHAWADFELPRESADSETARFALAASLSSQPPVAQYFEHLEDVSDFGSATNTPTMAELSVYHLHYGKTAQFYVALREFHDALCRAGNQQRFEWFELRTGGETPQFMLIVPRDNWAAFDVDAEAFYQRVAKSLGKRKTTRLFEQFTSAVKSHERSAVRLRSDLSLLPQ
jgi:hypothetical protein